MKEQAMRIVVLLALLALAAPGQGLVPPASKDDWEEINFEFNSAVLTDGFPSLLRLADLLSKNADYRVKLDGHTDYIGSEKYNEKLSERRANAVKAFLEKYGTRPTQIEIVPRGKRQPKVDNKTKEGRWINRRVELTVMDKTGKVIGAGGIGDAIKAMQATCPDYSQTLADILKKLDKLDDIAKALAALQGEHAGLRKDIDGLKAAQAANQSAVQQVAAAQQAAPKPPTTEELKRTVEETIKKTTEPKFTIVGMNGGVDNNGQMTFSGRGRYFSPFNSNFAIQAQGEYLYFKQRQEGQFDIAFVDRFTRRGQAGVFTSFKHVGMAGMANGAVLGQAGMTLDYLFSRGRVGFFGTKAFLSDQAINRTIISRNVYDEQYLRVVDQVGGSGAISLWGKSMLEGNLGWLSVSGGSNKPGGTIRLIQPVSNRVALTLEGGWNETFISKATNGRFVAGVQFGNYTAPKDYLEMDKPVPIDIPRVRYEMLTRRVRTGNDPPVADAGPDQLGVPAGAITLDGSASYDPDGDPITYQWDQVAGPAVEITGRTLAKASFRSAEGQTYSFRLTVKDSYGAQSIARTTVTTREVLKVVIQKFTATPSSIRPGGSSTLSWQVLNADEVELSTVGKVNPQSGAVQVSPGETTVYKLTARNKGGEVSDTVQVTVDRPTVRIVSFRAAPSSVQAGEASNLIWETENADTVRISEIGNVQPTGTASISPKDTTTYTLTASNKFGSVSATATVTVTKPAAPRVLSFTANPVEIGEGETSTLSWKVQGATEVTITNLGNQTLEGSTPVKPTTTTTYVLVAKNPGGEASASVTVKVIPQVKIQSFTANPSTTDKPGAVSRLTWSTTGATEVSISGVGAVAASGSVDVTPTQDTTYVLTAKNSKFSQTQSVTVKVTIPVEPPKPNTAPVIKLNVPDYFETINRFQTIDASQTYDAEGDALTFQWRQIGGSNFQAASINNANSPTVQIQLLGVYGDYVFELTVRDARGAESKKQFTIKFVSTRVP